jgi:Flp pilus assembly protein protease CpaA
MYKHSLKYGAASGITLGTIMVATYYAGLPTRGNNYLLLANLFFMFISSFLTIYTVRKINGGDITFKDALKIGLLAGWLTTLIFTIFTAVYYNFLNPNFADKYLVDIEISLKQAGVTGAELKKEMAQWRIDISANNRTLMVLNKSALSSGLLAAINAIILCKKD